MGGTTSDQHLAALRRELDEVAAGVPPRSRPEPGAVERLAATLDGLAGLIGGAGERT